MLYLIQKHESTNYKEGEKALLMLNWCMELENVERFETGNTLFVLTEVYETVAGVDDLQFHKLF